MSSISTEDLMREFCEGKDPVYKYLYFYGDRKKVKEAAKKLMKALDDAYIAASVLRLTDESFTESLVAAARERSEMIHALALSRCDYLLLEGIEGFAGKEASMQQLYYVLDKRLESGLPFAVFGSRAPSALRGIEPRIRAILEGMLINELK